MHSLYRGLWPKNVNKLAKYTVSFVDGQWRVTVGYEVEDGLRFFAVEGGDTGLAALVNDVKTSVARQPGGSFYVNEYRHVIVPVKNGTTSEYYYAGRATMDFTFEFEGKIYSTRPVNAGGNPLNPGDKWYGPRPGIPYTLAAGGQDVKYETPALTESSPPQVRPNMTRTVKLSKVLRNSENLARATQPVRAIRGYEGGRFYVNEHLAAFTPVAAGDGDGLDYIYCGQIPKDAWFPEPAIDIESANDIAPTI